MRVNAPKISGEAQTVFNFKHNLHAALSYTLFSRFLNIYKIISNSSTRPFPCVSHLTLLSFYLDAVHIRELSRNIEILG